ncbi:methyl-accepting chemotaxis protein [Imhoffiella purpurea]|uniref:Methyl-accepting chemotaxis protein n=1 Tax=Imhoffiella purpurea TaxID=1249627 RepID=W9VFB8_9GAMM|nr:methyl-accepting chemotaxis protein [Imhoffiella purpurea]EXJ14742.1 Methyl-accepting chemotaxis protein [Imhoffiella purpurea]
MKIADLTISAKLTMVTTGLVLAVLLVVTAAILWGLQGLDRERHGAPTSGGGSSPAELLQKKGIRSIETAGALLAEIAARDRDEDAKRRLGTLISVVERDPDIAYVAIRNADGTSRIGEMPESRGSFREFPVERDGRSLGKVVIGLKHGFQTEAYGDPGDQTQLEVTMALVIALLLLSALVAGFVIYLAITRLSRRFILMPAERIRNALDRMEAERDFSERLEPGADDELGRTVAAFNRGIDFLERQNDLLNESIIEMLQIGNEISQARDLTLTLPVKEDITGPLSDALNQITSESARVLVQVREIAERVERASLQVQAQGRRVVEVADAERAQIEQTATDLGQAVEAVEGIAELARFCRDEAATATSLTDQAMGSVRGSVEGMAQIRSSIQQTGKRIKRLGERSQEIGGIVDIIKSFSERTHVLAINAAMQAATSGEAGRGFAVVAQEVQRLADSSRNATNQIETLIANIQVETQDSIQTVNDATEAVTRESHTVESAGELMLETQQTAASLAETVSRIDERAQSQVVSNRALMERVESMRAGTLETTEQIDQQTLETGSLVGYSRQLLETIQLFRLPGPQAPADGTRG